MYGHARWPLRHPSRRKLVDYLARIQGVSPEHFLEIVARRKAYRLATMYRRRSRKRSLERNPRAVKTSLITPGQIAAGEGELHAMMRLLGLTTREFCEIAGISRATFDGWCGHPMTRWPIRLLYHFYRAKMMEEWMKRHGVDVAQFEPPEFREVNAGRYPRKKDDVDVTNVPVGSFNPLDRL